MKDVIDNMFDVLLIDIVDIIIPNKVMRGYIDDVETLELADSIKEVGLINPITVRSLGNKYELIAGHRRILAHELLGLEQIHSRVVSVEDKEVHTIRIQENLQRAGLSPEEEGLYFQFVINRLEISQAELARMIGKSPSYVTERLEVLNYPRALADAMSKGSISFSTARELNKIGDLGYIDYLIEISERSGMSPAYARQCVKEWRAMQREDWRDENELRNERKSEQEPTGVYMTNCVVCKLRFGLGELQSRHICQGCLTEVLPHIRITEDSTTEPLEK